MIRRLLVSLIQFYRKYLSQLFLPACRFHPTCSHYAEEAIQKNGTFVGVLQTIGRLTRCHPFSAGWYDPVP